jgi:hypothetical protein
VRAAAKREQAAMREATQPKATAKQAPAKPAAKKVEPSTQAKAPASKKPAPEKKSTESKPKIKWQYEGEHGKSAMQGVASDGTVYAIDADGDAWKATKTPEGGKPETLPEGVSIGAAYSACIRHAKAQAWKAA